jgi:hypothetical protein
MSATSDLLQEIREGAQQLGIAPTTLCHRAVNNGHLVKRLENGRSIEFGTADKIRAYIRDNRPKADETTEAAE